MNKGENDIRCSILRDIHRFIHSRTIVIQLHRDIVIDIRDDPFHRGIRLH